MCDLSSYISHVSYTSASWGIHIGVMCCIRDASTSRAAGLRPSPSLDVDTASAPRWTFSILLNKIFMAAVVLRMDDARVKQPLCSKQTKRDGSPRSTMGGACVSAWPKFPRD